MWATIAGLGFHKLNQDRTFTLRYGNSDAETKQIDVFAADDETVLVVECKSALEAKHSSFKTDIEAIQGRRNGILKTIQKEYPGHKVKFLFATNGYDVSQPGQERIDNAKIIHLDEDAVEYYRDLTTHLGGAARFQFLGFLFAGQKIPGMDAKVTAVRSKMGGHTYFSFSIEPSRLLKLAYVLHRNKANSRLMPTYQRLIKKSRLKKVRDFVEDDGFFPNSLILNIDTPRRGLRFDRFAGQSNTASTAGTLHLPKTYRAAYVIDGQHRLYGYVDSSRASSDLIPVVAFVNLERSEQVSIFMQINENQTAVPKNLRNTLNADLLWDSENLQEQAKALKLRIAQHLGEARSSPLYGRVIMGENKRSVQTCITIDAISIGLERGNFLGSFSKTEMREIGTFYRGSNQATLDALTPFLELAFDYFREWLPEQWELGNADGGFVFINNGVESLLRVLSDIVDQLFKDGTVKPRKISAVDLFEACQYCLDPLIDFLSKIEGDEADDFRRLYGVAGRTRYWRLLQTAIREAKDTFEPDGLAQYLQDQEKAFNEESFKIIRDVEQGLKRDVRELLEIEFGAEWFKLGVPRKVYLGANALAAEKNLDRAAHDEVEPWDCIHLIDYQKIMLQNHDLWKRRLEKRYTKPGDEEKAGGWKKRVGWLVEMNRIRNENDHSYSVKESEYEFLLELKAWLVEKVVDNNLPS